MRPLCDACIQRFESTFEPVARRSTLQRIWTHWFMLYHTRLLQSHHTNGSDTADCVPSIRWYSRRFHRCGLIQNWRSILLQNGRDRNEIEPENLCPNIWNIFLRFQIFVVTRCYTYGVLVRSERTPYVHRTLRTLLPVSPLRTYSELTKHFAAKW